MKKIIPIFLFLFLNVNLFGGGEASPTLNIQFNGGTDPSDMSVGIQLVLVMTLLTLLPSMIMLTTCFTRIVIVLGFVRNALGVASSPSNQIIVGLSLFLTFFLMGKTWDRVYDDAVQPYMNKQIKFQEACDIGSKHLKNFMIRQTRSSDMEFFLGLSSSSSSSDGSVPLRVIVPAFILSELRTAFQMGFMIFVPFLIIDFLVASILMAMGMMMMPPAMISLPFKLLLFVLVDGWTLVIKSLVQSFKM